MTYHERVELAAEGQMFLILNECECPLELCALMDQRFDEFAWNASHLVRRELSLPDLRAGTLSSRPDCDLDRAVDVHLAVVDDVKLALAEQFATFADEFVEARQIEARQDELDNRGYL